HGRLDDTRGLLREARTEAHVDEHRVVRWRGTGVDVRERLRAIAGDAAGARRDEAAHRAGPARRQDGPFDRAAGATLEPGDVSQSDRAGQNRKGLWRHLLLAHPR